MPVSRVSAADLPDRPARSQRVPERKAWPEKAFRRNGAAAGALLGAAMLAGSALPAAAEQEPGGRFESAALTLENARPLAVPPRPNLRPPAPIKAPPRFVTPDVMQAPEPPQITIGPAPRDAAPNRGTAAAQPPAQAQAAAPGQPPTAQPPETAQGAAPSGPPGSTSTQTAALPPPSAPAPRPAENRPSDLNIVFEQGSGDLPPGVQAMAEAIAERMRASQSARLELRSYASGTAETAREARQLSLSRGIALRERLEALGVPRNRVGVRPLGIAEGGGPPDRIDIDFLNE
ncbi:hypothetical protein [Azospirillum sp. SYSU D00513]|uniref:hypothetical protein n=1 Tax=Azospirillum sp. SYSU D00513 TaxID=2812561 RepID=UPI0032B38087